MRSFVVASALCGLVAAAPRPQPQNINIGAIDDLPTPTALGPDVTATTTPAVTYVPEIAASSAAAALSTDLPRVEKRAPSSALAPACTASPGG